MKIISCNACGLSSRKKRSLVKGFLRSQNPEILMPQETKRKLWDRKVMVSVWRGEIGTGYIFYWGALGGVVIICDSNKFECTEKVLGSFSILVKLKFGEGGSFWPTSVYDPNKPLWRKGISM